MKCSTKVQKNCSYSCLRRDFRTVLLPTLQKFALKQQPTCHLAQKCVRNRLFELGPLIILSPTPTNRLHLYHLCYNTSCTVWRIGCVQSSDLPCWSYNRNIINVCSHQLFSLKTSHRHQICAKRITSNIWKYVTHKKNCQIQIAETRKPT